MKNDRGKWILIIAMIGCLGLLFVICGGRDTVQEMYDYNNAMENESLSIAFSDGGSLVVEGEGKLTESDLKRMLAEKEITLANLTSITLGDGIAEVGYHIGNGYNALKVMRLGKNTEVVHDGAVKNSPSLDFIFVPVGLKSVLYNVHSYEDFIKKYDAAKLLLDGMEITVVDDPEALAAVAAWWP